MEPRHLQAITLRKALEIWVKHRIKVNTAWTPTNMVKTARRITGRKDLGLRDYPGAISALTHWLDRQRAIACGRAAIDKLARYQCEAGPLSNSLDFSELVTAFETLAGEEPK